jgi:hypothetical protein
MRSRWVLMASLVCSFGHTYAGSANAHALFAAPAPRDQQDGYKDGSACGVPFAASQPVTSYAPGQAVNVQWLETVDHPGCFLIELSADGDQSFEILGRKSHSNPPPPEAATSAAPRHWSLDVTLPSSPCSNCTLRLRQLMLDADVAADACSAAGAARGSIYTTCANIVLGAGGSGGSGGSNVSGGSGGSGVSGGGATSGGTGGSVTTAGSGTSGSGGAVVAAPAAGDSSCSLRPTRGHSLAVLTVLLVAMARRRRNSRTSQR